jgi:hypothetical protein
MQARSYAKPDALLNASIRENVHRSARDVLANSEVLRSAHEQGKLSVIRGQVYAHGIKKRDPDWR